MGVRAERDGRCQGPGGARPHPSNMTRHTHGARADSRAAASLMTGRRPTICKRLGAARRPHDARRRPQPKQLARVSASLSPLTGSARARPPPRASLHKAPSRKRSPPGPARGWPPPRSAISPVGSLRDHHVGEALVRDVGQVPPHLMAQLALRCPLLALTLRSSPRTESARVRRRALPHLQGSASVGLTVSISSARVTEPPPP